ncbi:hypothetical protein ACWIGW_44155 [Nocardia brasiliensis]|uniref:hypothetical protein n=1 Tax=Streptomyces sp. NPDC056056 TaxID=3345698 RepID=UPI0035DAB11A
MTLLRPFRHRDGNELALLRAEVLRRARKAQTKQQWIAFVDDVIDALDAIYPPTPTPETELDTTGAPAMTGVFGGPELLDTHCAALSLT